MINAQRKSYKCISLFLPAGNAFCLLFPDLFFVRCNTRQDETLTERMFSMIFVLLWLTLCIYSAWKRRLSLLVGGVLYAVMAYLPGWFLPHLMIPVSLYTSDAADDLLCVDLGGRRIIKKK